MRSLYGDHFAVYFISPSGGNPGFLLADQQRATALARTACRKRCTNRLSGIDTFCPIGIHPFLTAVYVLSPPTQKVPFYGHPYVRIHCAPHPPSIPQISHHQGDRNTKPLITNLLVLTV